VLDCLSAAWRYRSLLRQFTLREVLGRYRGSILGLGWSFFTPLAMLVVYTFVFVGVFRSRWPGAEEAGGVAFALRLFAGLMVFQLFSDVLGGAPTLITASPNLVKKVVFPVQILPLVALCAALFHFALSGAILLLAALVFEHQLPVTALLAPLAVLPMLPLLAGLGWLLSALGVFVRDIARVIGVAMSLLLFLSPVFYALESLDPRWQFWMQLNPMTPVIGDLRRTVFLGLAPDWLVWWAWLGIGLAVAAAGAWVFARARRGFADVL